MAYLQGCVLHGFPANCTLDFRNFGDVRDVALAHVRALELPEAGGQRFIAGTGPHTWQDAREYKHNMLDNLLITRS